MTLAPNICMTTTTAALTTSCAPDTTVGNGSAPTASLLMTSIVELQPLYARIQKSFSARPTVGGAIVRLRPMSFFPPVVPCQMIALVS